MKPLHYYETTTCSYPNKNDYTRYFVYDKGKVIWEGSYYEYKNKVDVPLSHDCVTQKVVEEEEYKKLRKKYDEEYYYLLQEFENDLYAEYGVSENPKRHKCYALAWERGHAYGLGEVCSIFSELVELIVD